MFRRGRKIPVIFLALLISLFASGFFLHNSPRTHFHRSFRWRDVPIRYPINSITELPAGEPADIPLIQFQFQPETKERLALNKQRQNAVREAFTHSWSGYKKKAWLQDEVLPITGKSKNNFGGWAATLVDSLDTMWIMGLHNDFKSAIKAISKLDFSSHNGEKVNVFETTIRHLGGLLSAYDISDHKHPVLLDTAIELGDMLYTAFDTPNRMPVTRWDWKNGAKGGEQEANRAAMCAELGSMSLEFTHLSQLTGDPKYYDAVARVTNFMASVQNDSVVPGVWPVYLNALEQNIHDMMFTLGGMVDSAYEYLPKQHIMLGGRTDQYREMYTTALATAKEKLFYRAMNPQNRNLTMAGSVRRWSALSAELKADGQHLTCFLGGMVALAAKIFEQPEELETARQLVDGCIWAYESMPSGIMPEKFTAVICKTDDCEWSTDDWYAAITKAAFDNLGEDYTTFAKEAIVEHKLVPGFAEITDPRFLLRPEAIESLFILYRVTGDVSLQDKAWDMFQSINNVTRTEFAYASVLDVRSKKPELIDSMESFWTAETLKYFFLIFSDPDLVSLDEFVFNTEAHPLLRPDRDLMRNGRAHPNA